MNTERVRRLEKLLDRELSAEEKERFGRIHSVLGITDGDALWDVVTALEYQRTFYEELPQKIAAASTEILQGISVAAEKEMGRAQSLLAENVAEQARKMSLRLNMETLLPMGLVAVICLVAYGSLLMWAGYCLGSRYVQDMALILRMPSGFLMSALCLAGSLFQGVYAARKFAEEGKGWWKNGLAALAMLASGGVIIALAL